MKIIRPFKITDQSLVSCNIPEDDYPVWLSSTTYGSWEYVTVANKLLSATISIGSPTVVTSTTHSLPNNTPIVFRTTGVLPTGISANIIYYVVNAATNTLQISLTSGGAAIATSGTQSGIHSLFSLLSPVSSVVGISLSYTSYVVDGYVVSGYVETAFVGGANITWVGHGFLDDDRVTLYSTGSMPTGLSAGVSYYITAVSTDSFQVALSSGGGGVVTTSSGTGTFYAAVQYHKTYQSLTSSNIGFTPHKNASKWLDLKDNNRWRVFDDSITSSSINANSIEFSVQTTGRIDSVALLNVEAGTVTISAYDSIEGLVYGPITNSLIDTSTVSDWYTYFFEPINFRSYWYTSSLPLYANLLITIEIRSDGNNAKCGGVVLGTVRDLGLTQYGASVGIVDYSVKQRDDFGNYSVLERSFSRRGTFTVQMPASSVDPTVAILSKYRATPCVYIGADDYQSSIIYGFYKDFSVDISYPTLSICSLEIEGLT
jgi:hypothetical protein